ncbi:hypothetical protein Hypma_003106 [Hypsizygus marmoreus]|uniref:Uncharacterized protein n=1 Tax=Hypsizygus marmoreus TaxID=39966 RepID=A0A369J2I8_HYPMA|nr:hypothetical protein Hypma_003106 [Hypsizygus marmoreus]
MSGGHQLENIALLGASVIFAQPYPFPPSIRTGDIYLVFRPTVLTPVTSGPEEADPGPDDETAERVETLPPASDAIDSNGPAAVAGPLSLNDFSSLPEAEPHRVLHRRHSPVHYHRLHPSAEALNKSKFAKKVVFGPSKKQRKARRLRDRRKRREEARRMIVDSGTPCIARKTSIFDLIFKDSDDESAMDTSEESVRELSTSSSSSTHAGSSSLDGKHLKSFVASTHADVAMLAADDDMLTSPSHISTSTSYNAAPTSRSPLQDQDLPLDFSERSPALSLVTNDVDGTFSPPDFQDQIPRPLHTIPSPTPSSERLSGSPLVPSAHDFAEDVVGRHRANTLDDVHDNDDHHETRSTTDSRRHDTAREEVVQASGKSNLPCPTPALADRALLVTGLPVRVRPPLPHRRHLLPVTKAPLKTSLTPAGPEFAAEDVERDRTDTFDTMHDDDGQLNSRTTVDAGTNGIARERTYQASGTSNSPPPTLILAERVFSAAGCQTKGRDL